MEALLSPRRQFRQTLTCCVFRENSSKSLDALSDSKNNHLIAPKKAFCITEKMFFRYFAHENIILCEYQGQWL